MNTSVRVPEEDGDLILNDLRLNVLRALCASFKRPCAIHGEQLN